MKEKNESQKERREKFASAESLSKQNEAKLVKAISNEK
jgi:hypothetical protein